MTAICRRVSGLARVAFTVGLTHAVYALDGRHIAKDAPQRSHHVEQRVLPRARRPEDQVSAAFGGFNHITIAQNGTYSVTPIGAAPDGSMRCKAISCSSHRHLTDGERSG